MALSDRQQQILELYIKTGNKSETARQLGIARQVVQQQLTAIKRKGVELPPTKFSKYNPPGFESAKTCRRIDYDENGVGRVKTEWLHSAPALERQEDMMEYLEHRTPVSRFSCKVPRDCNRDLMVEWCMADLHHGMRAAIEETGKEHNIQLSRRLVEKSATDIFSRTDNVAVTRIVSLGDFHHSDFFSNKTEKSGHSLWTSDTYSNIARCGVESILAAVEIALQKSDTVEVEFLPGNHCQQSSTWLQLLLEFHYVNNNRVIVSNAQTKARYARWGCTFFGYHHGDTTNPTRLAIDVLTKAVNEEPGLRYFYARTAHLHNSNKMLMAFEDHNGVIVERIPTITPKDKFTADGCYNSVRGTVANVFHKEKGLRYRLDVLPDNL